MALSLSLLDQNIIYEGETAQSMTNLSRSPVSSAIISRVTILMQLKTMTYNRRLIRILPSNCLGVVKKVPT